MTREHIIESSKIAIAVVIAVLVARTLQMQFYMSVATIVIVSMLSAKKQSVKLAATRLFAAVLSLTLSSILFSVFGFSLWVFILYILIFTYLMFRMDTKVAIVLNVVLVMHIYTLQEISIPILLNEFGLMFLSILVALLVNTFTLDMEDELVGYQDEVENLFDSIFVKMGMCLSNQCNTESVDVDLVLLNERLTVAKKRSYNYMNNFYFIKNNYYVEYFSMRRRQYYIVKGMQKFISLNFLNEREVQLLKNFTDQFVNKTKVLDMCQEQIDILDTIKHHFTHEADLPPDRNQLHNRIALHQYLYSLEDLVSVKMRFIERYEKE